MTDKPKKTRAPGAGRKPLSPGEVTRPRTIRLPPSWWERLEGQAKARGMTLSVLMREIIGPHADGGEQGWADPWPPVRGVPP